MVESTKISRTQKIKKWHHSPRLFRKGIILLTFMLPGILFYAIFHYAPMYGTLIAFMEYNPFLGFMASPFVGLKHFNQFFSSIYFERLLTNTLTLSLFNILFSFPIPILYALLLNEVRANRLRSLIQSISYFPHFISTVIVCGLLKVFLSPSTGFINAIITALGGVEINFLARPEWFRTIYIASGIWQGMGWGSIIYYATLSSVDPSQYEAAEIDGASRLQKAVYISMPALIPTITTLLLMNLGNMLNVGFEKVLLLYSTSTYSTADIISTYVYRSGISSMQYSYAAAVGLFNSFVGIVLITLFNAAAKKIGETSLW